MIDSYSQTKIVVTIGPATSSKEMLRKMFIDGVDVCRLNFSHGSHEDHLSVIKNIRELNRELDSHISILADLQGPKIRIGEMENNGVEFQSGDEVSFTTKPCLGNKTLIHMQYSDFAADVNEGEMVLVDDGKIRLQVLSTNRQDEVLLKVINGGIISSHKGVNLPDTKISQPSLTPKDIRDAGFAIANQVDWIALSFVRTAQDIKDLRKLIDQKGEHIFIVAKIEKPEALDDIENIIEATDAVMVARGDLGVEVPFDQVPLIQKKLVNQCIEHSVPVIIATQMLESMIVNFRPTRAEATDVANAVLDGADALMLSGETSVGEYPLEAISSMQRIIDFTEKNGYHYHRHINERISSRFLADSICDAANTLAQKSEVKAIICFSHTGRTAFRMAGHRPEAPIFVFTNDHKLISRLTLVWGIRAFYFDMNMHTDKAILKTTAFLREQKLLQKGDVVIHLARMPLLEEGKTNMVRLCFA